MMSLQKLNYSLLTTTINQQQNRKNKTLITPTRELSPPPPPPLPPAITNAVTSDLINISRCSDSGKSSSCSPTTIPDCSFDSGIEAVITNTITTATNTTNTNTYTLHLLPTPPHNTNMQLHKNLQQFERILQALERDREHYYKLRERLSKITERNKKKPLSEQIFCNVCCTEIQTNQLKTFVKCDSCQKLICRNIKCGDWLPKLAQWECELCQTSKDSLEHTSSWVANQLSFNEHKLAYPLRARSEIFIPITDCNDDNANFESISQTGANSAVVTVEQKLKIRKYVEEIVAQLLGGNLDAISVQQLSKSDNYLKLFTKYHSILSEIFSNMEEVLIKQQQQKQQQQQRQPHQKNSSNGDGNGNGFDLSSPKTNNKQNGCVPYNGDGDDVDNATYQQQQQSRKNSTDFTDISETRLRQMIQKIIAETVTMPPLTSNQAVSEIALDHRSSQTTLDRPNAKRNGQRHRSEYYFEPKVYQDLLATAVLNKIVDKQSQNKVMSESTPDLRNTHHDVLDTNYNLECQSTTSGSSVEPNSDCSYSEIDRLLNNDVDKSRSQMGKNAGRESEMSDYVAAHMVPLPDLSNLPTESEEDDFVSVTSSAKGEGNWENNWLFKKKPGPISGSVSGILIPNPKEDIRAQIGDKAADEFSDLSELGSETDDSSSSLHTKIDPLNHRLLNKELIGGQNGKMILDELIEQSTAITSSGEYEGRDHQYTDTLNEHVIDAPAKNEAINANIGKQSDCKGLNEVKGEAAEENKTEDVDFTAEIIEQPSSVIEILAAMALRPMIAVPTGDQSPLLTSDELTKLEEMKDLALAEIKSKGGAVMAHDLEMIPEEINEIKPFEDFVFDLKNLPPLEEMSLQFIEENLILKPPTDMEEALMDVFIVPPPEFEVDVTESRVIEKDIVEISESILKEDVTLEVQQIEETHESESKNDVSMEKPAINNKESEETMTVVESNAVQVTTNTQNTEKNDSIVQELTNLQEPSTSELMQVDTNDDIGAADVSMQTISEEDALRVKYERNETIDIDSKEEHIESLKKEATDKTVAPETTPENTNASEEDIIIEQHNTLRTTQEEAFNEEQAYLEQKNLGLETIHDNFENNNTSLPTAMHNADNILEDTILEIKNENISETMEGTNESLTCNVSKAKDEPNVVLDNNENEKTKLEEQINTLLKENDESTIQPTMAEALTNIFPDKENAPDVQENAKPISELNSDNVADLSEIEMAPISEIVTTAEALISNEVIKEDQEVIDSSLHNQPTIIEVLTDSIDKGNPLNIDENTEVSPHLDLDNIADPSVVSKVKKYEIEMATISTNVLTDENLTIAHDEDTNDDGKHSQPSLLKQSTIVAVLTDSIDKEDPSNIDENTDFTPNLNLDNVPEPSVVSIIKKCEIDVGTICTNVVTDESLTITHEEDMNDYDGIHNQPSLLKQTTIIEVLKDSIDIEDSSNIEENAQVIPHLDLDNVAEPSVVSIVKKYEIEIATISKNFATEESLPTAHEESKNHPSLNRQPTLTEIFEELMDKDSNILNISVKIESSEAQNLVKDKEVNGTVCSEVTESSLVSTLKRSEIETASMLEETISEETEESNKNQGSFLPNQHTVTDILTDSFDKEDPSNTALDIEETKSLTPLDNVAEPSLVSILKKSEIEMAYISDNIMADEISALPHEDIKNEEIETYNNTISRQTVAELSKESEDETETNISVTVETSNKPDSMETNKIEEVAEATTINDSSNKIEMETASILDTSKNEQVIGNLEETSASIKPSNIINEPRLTPLVDLSNVAEPSLKTIENESEIQSEKLEKDLNEIVENNDRLEISSTDITNDIAKESTGEVTQSITCENVENLIECTESTKEDVVVSVEIEKTVDADEPSKISTNLIEETELKIMKEISESIISEPSVELQDSAILQSPLTEQSTTIENLMDFDASIENFNTDQDNVMNDILSNQLIADLLAQPLLDLNLQEETADHIIEPPSIFASMEFIEQSEIIGKGNDVTQEMEETLGDSTDNNAVLVKVTPEDDIENTSPVLIVSEAVCESQNGCSEGKNTEANLCVDSNVSTIPDTIASEGVIITKAQNMTESEQIGSASELCEAALIVNESFEELPPNVQESVKHSTQTIVALEAKVDIPFLKPQTNLSENEKVLNVISENSEEGPEKVSNVSSESNADAPGSSITEDITTEPVNEAAAAVEITEQSPQANTTEPIHEAIATVEIAEQSPQANTTEPIDEATATVEIAEQSPQANTTEPIDEATATVEIAEQSPQANTTEPINEVAAAVEIAEQSPQANTTEPINEVPAAVEITEQSPQANTTEPIHEAIATVEIAEQSPQANTTEPIDEATATVEIAEQSPQANTTEPIDEATATVEIAEQSPQANTTEPINEVAAAVEITEQSPQASTTEPIDEATATVEIAEQSPQANTTEPINEVAAAVEITEQSPQANTTEPIHEAISTVEITEQSPQANTTEPINEVAAAVEIAEQSPQANTTEPINEVAAAVEIAEQSPQANTTEPINEVPAAVEITEQSPQANTTEPIHEAISTVEIAEQSPQANTTEPINEAAAVVEIAEQSPQANTTEPIHEAISTVEIAEQSPQANTTEPINEVAAAVEITEQSSQANTTEPIDEATATVEIAEQSPQANTTEPINEVAAAVEITEQSPQANTTEPINEVAAAVEITEQSSTLDALDTDRTNVKEVFSKSESSVQVVETSDVSDTDKTNVDETASKSESLVQVVEEKQTSDVFETEKSNVDEAAKKNEPSSQVVEENQVSEEVSTNITEAVNAMITTEVIVGKESTEIESKELPLTDIKADTQQENHDIVNTESSTLIVTESAIPTDPTQQAETLQLIVKESASVEVSSLPPLQSSAESCEDCKTIKSFSLNEEEDTQVNLGNHMLLRRLHRQDCIADSNAPSLEDDSQYLNKKTIGLGDMCQQYIHDKRLLAALEKRRRQILVMHRYLSSFDETTDSSAEDELISAFQGNSENATYSLGSTSPANDSDPSSSSDCHNHSHPVGELYENSFHIFNNVLFSDQLTNDSSNAPPTDEEYIENDTNFEEVEITTNTINHHTIDHECLTTTNNNYNNNNNIITNTHHQQQQKQQQQQNHHQLLLNSKNSSCSERTSAVESSTTSSNQTIHNELITKRCITLINHHDNNNKKRNDDDDDDDNVIEMKESDDIVAVLPKFVPGSIAEREHKKWFNAVEMPNNPYAPEALKRRISGSQESYIDLPNISPSKDSNPLEHLTQGKLNDEEQNQRENEYRRYSRDYYINNGRKSSSSNNSIHEANNQQPTKAENGEENYSEENTLLPVTSASSPTNHTVASISPDGVTHGDDVVYKAIPVKVVVVVEESVSSLDTVSSQKSIKSETYSTSGDDTETVRIYDFKKQETTVIRQNGDNHHISEKEQEATENHEMKQKQHTEEKGEAAVMMRERPKQLSLNRSESIGRGSTPTAFKFLQPKRKLINPSQVLSFEEDVPVLTTCVAERPVIEKEIVQALPSVKALAKAFLLSSSTSQPSQTEHTEPKKLKILTPTQKKSIDGTNKMIMESSPYENEPIEDTTITSDLSSLETDPSSVIEIAKDKPIFHSTPGTPTDTTSCKAMREGGANGGGGLRNNIAFFENLKFK